jgi:hypothetical protein
MAEYARKAGVTVAMQLLYQRVENVAVYAHSSVGKKGYAKGGVAELRRPRHNAQRQVGEIP